jgi:hypothetical protein
MNKLSFSTIGLVAILVTNLSAQANVVTASAIPVHNHTQKGKGDTWSVLQALAEKYHVVIGVYGDVTKEREEDTPTFDISIEDGTLGDVFDAITKADPRFEWHQNANGAVHFLTHGTPNPLADVTVHSFDDKNFQEEEIADHLFLLPEIQDWLHDHKCVRYHEIINGGPPRSWKQFSVHARDLPLSSILEEIAAKSHTYYWFAAQFSTKPCKVDVALGDVQP